MDSKDHTCAIQVNAGNKNTPSMHHPRRWNVTTSMVGLKTIPYAKISQKMVKPRDIAGSTEEEEFYTIKASDSKTQQRATLRYWVLVLTNQHNINHLAPILSLFHTLSDIFYLLEVPLCHTETTEHHYNVDIQVP